MKNEMPHRSGRGAKTTTPQTLTLRVPGVNALPPRLPLPPKGQVIILKGGDGRKPDLHLIVDAPDDASAAIVRRVVETHLPSPAAVVVLVPQQPGNVASTRVIIFASDKTRASEAVRVLKLHLPTKPYLIAIIGPDPAECPRWLLGRLPSEIWISKRI
jgi:hypothetical protein